MSGGGKEGHTEHDGRDEQKTDPLHNNMQPPVRQVGAELPRGEGQAADKEDEGHGAVDDAVLGPDGAAVGGDGCWLLAIGSAPNK